MYSLSYLSDRLRSSRLLIHGKLSAGLLSIGLILCTIATPCHALDPDPRRWNHVPVGTDFAGAAYVYTEADISFDPVSPESPRSPQPARRSPFVQSPEDRVIRRLLLREHHQYLPRTVAVSPTTGKRYQVPNLTKQASTMYRMPSWR